MKCARRHVTEPGAVATALNEPGFVSSLHEELDNAITGAQLQNRKR